MSIKQSVCFNPFSRSGLEPEELVKAASRIGYKSVEMLPQEHWNLVHDNGLDIAIVSYGRSRPLVHGAAVDGAAHHRHVARGRGEQSAGGTLHLHAVLAPTEPSVDI